MKAIEFDILTPPELTIKDGKSILKFYKLPPTNRNPNPLYKRLEVLIGNTIGYQYKIKKSEDNLTYVINTTDEDILLKIINLFDGFHSNDEFIRYDNRDEFITTKEVNNRIKELLIKYLDEFEFKSKSQNKISIQKDDFILTIEWSFIQGDASREFSFNWRVSSEEITRTHNEVINRSEFNKTKELSLLGLSQYYDRIELSERKFDVANIDEVDKCVQKYLKYLELEILQLIRNSLTYEKIINKIEYRDQNQLNRFPERNYYILGLLNYKTSKERVYQLIEKVKNVKFNDGREEKKMELLKRKLASS